MQIAKPCEAQGHLGLLLPQYHNLKQNEILKVDSEGVNPLL